MKQIYVEILDTRGSVPRDAGTVMAVTEKGISGTIGGGALEHRAIATARHLLKTGGGDTRQTIPLGPNLGQCCGGAVTLFFTSQEREIAAAPVVAAHPVRDGVVLPLWVWGAGHVGRAIVTQAAATGAFDIIWIDSAQDRFPIDIPQGASPLSTADMPRFVSHAPKQAHHLILTYSHEIDLALCAALLRHGFASCGLIGSATKKARFAKRLAGMGLDFSPITCPIGDKTSGKHPDCIAAGTIRGLMAQKPETESV